MVRHFSQREDPLTEAALAEWIIALERLVFDLLLLGDAQAAPLTDNLHVHTGIKFVHTQQQFIIAKQVVTFQVVALETDL